jgi:hypothetical protein
VTTTAPRATLDGAALYIRYGYPPNELGACGPDDHRALFEYGVSGTVDGGLLGLASAFTGAWPYVRFIAEQTGLGDPLDYRVVEAYWIGNELLDRIDMSDFGRSLDDRFRHRSGPEWGRLAEGVPAGGVPNHAFHVFGIYPWVDLLGSDRGPHPLHVLDRCRIRWGEVVSVVGDQAVVESRPLLWSGRELHLGPPRAEVARVAIDGRGFLAGLEPGDAVSLHWDWVCDRLTDRQLANLQRSTRHQLDLTNRRVGRPGDLLE